MQVGADCPSTKPERAGWGSDSRSNRLLYQPLLPRSAIMNKLITMMAGGMLAIAIMSFGTDAQANKKLVCAGCGISKSAFMAEMAAAYKKKTGVEIDFKGGGATKGIREVANNKVDIGGTCRHVIDDPDTLATVPEERRTILTPVG